MEHDMAMCGTKKMAMGGKAKKMMGGGYANKPMMMKEGGKAKKMAMGGKCRGMGSAMRGGNYSMA
jgi:hypothetical protein